MNSTRTGRGADDIRECAGGTDGVHVPVSVREYRNCSSFNGGPNPLIEAFHVIDTCLTQCITYEDSNCLTADSYAVLNSLSLTLNFSACSDS